MMEFQTYKCNVCGEQFIVACLAQLQEKLKNHKCVKNKRFERTRQLIRVRRDGIALYVRDFDNLVKQETLVNA